ncbi:MAG: imidazole glycerol phosphate synthase subunit HisH [Anaerolineales bacterium]|nr:imidazole glycerol phosphate synthase subunit HisH [Anaerolineales bacterium]
MIVLIDYGIGNLRSVQKALEHVGARVALTDDPAVILAAEKVVLPGVGAFGDGMKGLRARGLAEAVREVAARGTPLLGICLGMQVLFEASEERGEHEGLGLLSGRVRRFSFSSSPSPISHLKVPHTGWNQIQPCADSPLLRGLPRGAYAYFNHSYYCEAQPADTLAITDYGGPYPSIVGRGRVYGIQFHPEKSQQVGLLLLKNFVERG